ncbi:aldo/keto reductase [Aurantimonas sp. VKM B-3413]|uniref:aldo/keto reductase n=1 Tax=Aurantimonas sp. VKM B-3413 TaxID=2779401 RepID=UPI001E4BF4E9|nr:aldo/keto reductase [Aurantimonas sp. VKM B-3413]MCB8840445.1 aldo/keto reductase [Aurantimonas sp. VKM B-3413]
MKIIEAHGAHIPAIGFGTYTLEGGACVEMVAEAIRTGYRHIDTARMYGNEREVGEGIRQAGIDRDELFVTTKVWWTELSEDKFLPSAERAVEALGINAVDLLLIHWPNGSIPLEESIDALNAVADRGLTRHIGVANFTSALLDEACAMSSRPLVCNQVEYHPFLSQEAVLSACRRHDMALIAYSPVGQGGAVLDHPVIREAAERHGRTPAQIVLAWEVAQEGVGAIPRTKNKERLAENLDVFDLALSDEEMRAITELTHRRQRLVDPSFAPNWDRN